MQTTGLAEMPAGQQYQPDDERDARIAESAYFRAAQRGFVGGDPVQDWRDAEMEIDGEGVGGPCK